MGQGQSTQLVPAPPSSPAKDFSTHPSTAAVSACPVDHKTREAWLKASSSPNPHSSGQQALPPKFSKTRLSTEREVSSIPRAPPTAVATAVPVGAKAQERAGKASHASASPNAQTEYGKDIHTSASGHWVYPSEAMFFDAMKRKDYSAKEEDMASVIPIHNAVNERTWHEILRWEKPYMPLAGAIQKIDGPRLVSFSGDSSRLTPKARWNSFLGYEKPFDRHDWIIDRQGTRVDYVIDFYSGRQSTNNQQPLGPSFYLDVRPKLNTLEGWKMRAERFVGWN